MCMYLYVGVCVIIASQSVFEYISTVSYIYTKDMTIYIYILRKSMYKGAVHWYVFIM